MFIGRRTKKKIVNVLCKCDEFIPFVICLPVVDEGFLEGSKSQSVKNLLKFSSKFRPSTVEIRHL